jgi:hypothetical protein
MHAWGYIEEVATRAIHVIWTTYMTWPPGDPRRHWSSLFDMYGRLIKAGHRLNLPDPVTLKRANELAKEPPKILSPIEIDLVAEIIGAHCPYSPQHAGGYVKIPRFVPIAAAVERTHTHLLLEPLSMDIGEVVGRLKSATSSAVCLLGNTDRSRTWTRGYWKVFVFEEPAVPIIADYVERHNVRQGLTPAPYNWIRPIK